MQLSLLTMQFVLEGRDHCESAARGLLNFEHHTGDPELFNGIFRSFHTLKGNSGLFSEYAAIATLTNAAEELMEPVRNGDKSLDSEMTDLLLAVLDQVCLWLGCIESSGAVPGDAQSESADLLAALAAMNDREASPDLATESSLPLLIPNAPDEVSTSPAPADKTDLQLKVLVAEDSPIQQTTLKRLLEDMGCRAIVVANGRDAVEEFENGDFDVILMDMLMPVMDGFEATRLIRERERITGGKIPVVALTSYSLKAIQEKCVTVGMSGYLAKPVVRDKLVEAVQRLRLPEVLSVPLESISSNLNDLPLLEPYLVLENFGYNVELYRELVELYLAEYSGHGDELAAKLAGNNQKEIINCAHSLKGIVSSIGGHRFTEVTRRIQNICLEETRPDVLEWAAIVKAQAVDLKYALEHIDWDLLKRFAATKL